MLRAKGGWKEARVSGPTAWARGSGPLQRVRDRPVAWPQAFLPLSIADVLLVVKLL